MIKPIKKARYVYGAQFGNISLGGETRNHVPDSFLRGGNFFDEIDMNMNMNIDIDIDIEIDTDITVD